MTDFGIRHRQVLRNTLVFFDPVLIDSEFEELSEFIETFVRQDGIYQFRINPTSLQVNKTKLTNTVLTEAGYERAYFGNGLTTLSYKGTTGQFWLPQALQGITRDIRLSPVWQKFLKFELFFEKLDGDICMINHRGDLYRGSLINFSYQELGEQPWHITYSFTMEAYTDEPGREQLGDAIKRLSFKSFLGEQLIPQTVLKGLNEILGIDAIVDTVPGRAVSDLF